jgi:hypothetical protein
MKRHLLLLLLFSVAIITFAQDVKEQFIFPAEFEKIDAIWMGWGITTYTDTASKEDVENIRLKMLQALTPFVQVGLIVNDTLQRNLLLTKFLNFCDTNFFSLFHWEKQIFRWEKRNLHWEKLKISQMFSIYIVL